MQRYDHPETDNQLFNMIRKSHRFGLLPTDFFNYHFWALGLMVMVLSSCGVNKYLKPGEHYLGKNTIEVEGPVSKKKKESLQSELYLQRSLSKPNSKIFGSRPNVWIYHKYSQPDDTSSFARFVRQRLAEEPRLYDSVATDRTASHMLNYLKSKGFPRATVTSETYFSKHEADVLYLVDLNKPYIVNSVQYYYPNQEIEELITKELVGKSALNKGDILSRDIIEQEKNTIVNIMRENGYASFSNIFFDPVRTENKPTDDSLNIVLTMNPGRDDEAIRKYKIGKVEIYNNYVTGQTSQGADSTVIDGIVVYNNLKGGVKPAFLRKNIFVNPGEPYKASLESKTRYALARLESVFRSPPTTKVLHPEDGTVDFTFYVVPNEKYRLKRNLDLNWTNRRADSTFLGIGLTVGAELTNNNVFGSGERLTNGLEFDTEINPFAENTDRTFTALSFRSYNTMSFRKFRNYLGTYKIFDYGKDPLLPKLRATASSNIDLNYNYNFLLDLYKYHQFSASFGNSWRSEDGNEELNVKNVDITVWTPTTTERFRERNKNNPHQLKSFSNQVFTGFLLKDISYAKLYPTNATGEQYAFNASLEVSGLEIMALNYALNQFSDTIRLFSKYDFAKYARLQIEGRFYKTFRRKHVIATRAGVGIAYPLPGSKTVPYVKRFALGGPLSMRAWDIRRLGVGSVRDSLALDSNVFGYQAGDFKLELNAEYRFPVFSILNGAIFTDIGNIWNLKGDEREGATLHSRFYRDLAVASGVGIRLDFSFFIARIDFAWKVKLPYKVDNSYWGITNDRNTWIPNTQFAVNLPF